MFKARQLWHFFILTRFVFVKKYSRAFVERPLQDSCSLASRLTTVNLDKVRFSRSIEQRKQIYSFEANSLGVCGVAIVNRQIVYACTDAC